MEPTEHPGHPEPASPTLRRPEGVTIIAIWYFITAIGCVFGLSGLGIGFLGLWTSGEAGMLMGTLGMMLAAMAVATTGVVYVVTGWALWNLKPWARAAAMVLAIFQVPLIVGIVILIYLSRSREVKNAFGILPA